MSRSAQDIVSAEQRYKFHRAARYLLTVPMVFLLDWWAAASILAVLPFEGAPRIAVFMAIFAILAMEYGNLIVLDKSFYGNICNFSLRAVLVFVQKV